MFYLTSKFHDNRVNTFGFMEEGGVWSPPRPQALELQKSSGGIGLVFVKENTFKYHSYGSFIKSYC